MRSFDQLNTMAHHWRARTSIQYLFSILRTKQILLALFVVTLVASAIAPQQATAGVATSKYLSYQGRLTDTNGNVLGGAGTNYCFRFSFYDALAAGAKRWPAGTPTTNTVNVINGVFNVGIGVADDLSTYDFSSYDPIWLSIDVTAQVDGSCAGVVFETLSPLQRIDAVAFSRLTFDLYGGQARLGTGAGGGTPKYVLLDVKNTGDTIGGACAGASGTMWYNSSDTKTRVCDNGLIQDVGNNFATSLTTPLVIGGTTTTSPLTLRSTSGAGTTGADIIFQTGTNGGTEAMRILNSGIVGIGTNAPTSTLLVVSDGTGTTAAKGIGFGDALVNLYRKASGSLWSDAQILTVAGLVKSGSSGSYGNGSFVSWDQGANGWSFGRDSRTTGHFVMAPSTTGENGTNYFDLTTSGILSLVGYGAGIAQFSTTGVISSTAPSTSGNILTSNGTAWISAAGGVLIGEKVKTAGNTTYTPTAGTTSIVVKGVAGGGGGGGATGVASTSASYGGGGASGGYVEKRFTGIVDTTTYTIAVGAGGAGGVAANGTGSTGDITTFACDAACTGGAVTITANGGLGGVSITTGTSVLSSMGGAAGAVSTNGDVNSTGSPGGYAMRFSASTGNAGSGAASVYGSGGKGKDTQGTGATSVGFGGGGAGAVSTGNQANAGGTGAPGVLIIEEYR